MSWERALEADARLAARNALLIRAALRQSVDFEAAFRGYQATTPNTELPLAQQRARARSWAIINIRVNLEAFKEVLYRVWAGAYVLGDIAAGEQLQEAREAKKADVSELVDWSKWKPGDEVAALLLKPPRAFQRLLQNQGITFKGFSDTTLRDLGNAIGEAIELGLDAKTSAKQIMNHVASPARALSIAITEQNRAISEATKQRYLDAGLEKMEWLVFDPCDICAKNANVQMPINQAFPSGDTQPPAHPHCRCALAPVIPGFDEPGEINDIMRPIEPTIGLIPESTLAETEKLYSEFSQMSQPQRPPGEERLAAAYIVKKYNELPEVLSADEFDTLVKDTFPKGEVVYRGIQGARAGQAAEFIHEYKHGKHYAGLGVYGNGTYTATSRKTALLYALNDPEKVMEIFIPDTSNFINIVELRAKGGEMRSALDDVILAGREKAKAEALAAGMTNFDNPIWIAWTKKEAKYHDYRTLLEEEGTLATLLGYDGIKVDVRDGFYYIILNRGKVKVKR